MKKRSISLLLCLVMIFSLLPFSAMAEETARGVYEVGGDDSATYTFKVDGNAVSTQIVRAGDTLTEPAAPAPGTNRVFDGWYVGETKLEFDENGSLVVDSVDSDVTVDAHFTDVWHVTFMNSDNDKVVSVKSVEKSKSLDLSDIHYNVSSTDGNTSVVGWTETQGSDTMVADPYTPTADVTLYPVIKSGFWLKFDENDGDAAGIAGATYTPAQFLTSGQTPARPSDPTRMGYSFGGWYTNAACTTPYNFTPISGPTTVYAKWNPDNAKYTIIIWKQSVTDVVGGEKHWDYAASVPLTAPVGSSQGVANNPYRQYGDKENVTINGKVYDFMGFQFDHCDSAKTVAADGSTILNVYYARRVISIIFEPQANDGNQTDWYGLIPVVHYHYHYIKTNGNEAETSGDTVTMDGQTYVGRAVYQGLYGAELNFEWPTEYFERQDNWILSDGWTETGNTLWYYDRLDNSTINPRVTLSFVGNFILPVKTASSMRMVYTPSGNYPIRFYKQSVNGDSWDLARQVYMSTVSGFTITDKFEGFTAYAYETNRSDSYGAESGWTKVTYNAANEDYGSTIAGSNDNHLHVFFKRNSYNIDFLYKDGTEARDTVVKKYQAPLSDVSEAAPAYPDFLPEGEYEFVGWFANPELTTYVSFQEITDAQKAKLTKDYGIHSFVSYAGQTMPTNNLVLYAGYFKIGFDCALNPNGGEFDSTQAGVFWVEINSQIDSVISEHVSRDGYSIAGWEISDVDGNLLGVYNDGPNNYRYVGDFSNWTSTDEDFKFTTQVKGPIYLTAKWLSNAALTVSYDLDGGTGSVTDGNVYLDGADVAVSGVVPTKEGYQFIGWKVEGEDELRLLPGGTLELNKANQDVNNNNEVVLTAVYDQVTNVTLTFNVNAASGSVGPTSVTLQKNAPYDLSNVTATSEGKVLIGWSKEADNTAEFKTNTVVATDCDATLYAVWHTIENYNYVIDFNGAMTIANSATEKKDDTHNNGAFDVADGVATYQLKADEESFADGANLVFNGVDTAMINGVPVNAPEGTQANWNKYTVIPANTVYFDDSLVGKSMTAGDGSGYNAAVVNNESSPTEAAGNEQGQATLTFTFKGTGIDIYCTCDKDAGWIQANVDGTAYPFVNSRYQESEGSTTAIYNTPVISIDGLAPNVEHTLTLRTLTNSKFRLDGIRVYNAMQGVGDEDTQAAVNNAYAEADESNAVFLEVRDRILAAGVFSNGAADTDIGEITGAVFLETQATGATIADYTAKGPKDEVYLAPGQAIAFKLGGWDSSAYKVMVGLSMPKSTDTGSATVYASGRGEANPITVNARTDMFYEITPDTSGNVIIKNASTGGQMISITKLKITTIEADGTPYTVPAQTTGEAVEEGTRGLRVDKSLMAYAMAFDPTTEVSPTDNVDEPEKPIWNDTTNLLKDLFSMLLKNLFDLFRGLGGW